MDLIFFGIQGSGKGTLGKSVAERYGMQIFETGGELRKLSKEDSDLGKKIKTIIEAGHLVSNEVVMEIVENFVNTISKDAKILFDGIPRKVEQANLLNALLDKHGRKYKGVLLNISKETAFNRLTKRRVCQSCKTVFAADYSKNECEKCSGELVTRSDDNPEAIQTRLDTFEKETVPTIEIYKEKLVTIDGEPPIDQVRQSAFEMLDPIMEN